MIFGWILPNTRISADNFAAKRKLSSHAARPADGNVFPQDLTTSIKALDATGPFAWVTKHITFVIIQPFFYERQHYQLVRPRIANFFSDYNLRIPNSRRRSRYCWGGQWNVEPA